MDYTLLELTQTILSSLDSDEINSIGDTVESQQVVKIIKTAYDDIIARGGFNKQKTLFTLEASGDASKPVLMTMPANITNVEWLRYNKMETGSTDPIWSEVRFLTVEDFMDYTSQFKPSDTEVGTFTYNPVGFSLTFIYKNNIAPTYYTSFDDNTVIFDSYDNLVDTTLQTSKTRGFGTRNYAFVESDTWVPELQPDQFPLLLNEAKSLAWAELKQSPNLKAEATAKKNWVHLSKTRYHVPTGKFDSGAHPRTLGLNFGRK